MMKQKLLSVGLAAVMLIGVLSGCGSTRKIVASEEYEVETDPAVTADGTWIVPGQDGQLNFQSDGTYTNTISKDMDGTFAYYKDVQGFELAEAFDEIEYIVLSDEAGEEQIFGAVLGDVIIGYWNRDNVYFLRENRETVPAEKLAGEWSDALGGKFLMTLNTDGTGQRGDKDNPRDVTYTYSEETGTLTIAENGKDEEYAVAMHEGFLFLKPVGNFYTMYLYQPA